MKRLLPLLLLTLGVTFPAQAPAGWGEKARSFLHRSHPAAPTPVVAEVASPEEAIMPAGEPAPEWYRKAKAGKPDRSALGVERVVKGRLSATRERALADARLQLDRSLASWLAPEVPQQWAIPKGMVDSMIRATHVEPIARDLGLSDFKDLKVVYEAGYLVDVSPSQRERIVEAYTRELVARRMALMGGMLGLSMIGLAGLAGYIRADEATKGYYTNRLRLLAAAVVGAGSVAFYRWAF